MAYMQRDDNRLIFLPLGGSGEIGMNLNLYGHKGKWLMVDCGMAFAGENMPGVDLVFPDPDFIEDEKDALAGLVVTHGHEDHIGAIPHLWQRFECPIYATPFTAELIQDKLDEAGLDDVPMVIVEHYDAFNVGPFNIRYLALAHSTAEGHGIVIKTEKGTVFHTGDWKLDSNPLIGPICPSEALQELGQEGVLALVGDSTNVFNESESGSEADVRASMKELVKDIDGRVVITTFASNVARLETIGEVAKASGREVVLIGRSMHRIYKAAKATGYLKKFPTLVSEEDAEYLPKDKILIACTGCQGEPRAALNRIARGDHRHIDLVAGDTVIFSSKMIPGNELVLGNLFNILASRDVNIITEKDAFVHVSGHPGQAELRTMYDWVKPKMLIPVHGEARHLKRHAEFGRSLGIEHTIVPANGDIIEIKENGLKLIDHAPFGRLALDGKTVLSVDDPAIVDRKRLMINGLVIVSLVFADDGALAAEPLLSIKGIAGCDDDAFYDAVLDVAETAVEKIGARARESDTMVEEAVRIAIRRFARREIGKNPGVEVMITRSDELDL